jgi:hypothetical protein
VTGSEGRTKSSGIREELDSFARTLDGIPLSKFRGQANTDSPLITSHLVKEQEIADKLARSRNELEQLERLVDKTFGRLGTDKNPVHTIDKVFSFYADTFVSIPKPHLNFGVHFCKQDVEV